MPPPHPPLPSTNSPSESFSLDPSRPGNGSPSAGFGRRRYDSAFWASLAYSVLLVRSLRRVHYNNVSRFLPIRIFGSTVSGVKELPGLPRQPRQGIKGLELIRTSRTRVPTVATPLVVDPAWRGGLK